MMFCSSSLRLKPSFRSSKNLHSYFYKLRNRFMSSIHKCQSSIMNKEDFMLFLKSNLNTRHTTCLYLYERTKDSKNLQEEILKHNIEIIKKYNWSILQVIQHPKALVQNIDYFNHRLDHLKEVGFKNDSLTIKNVFTFSVLMKKSIHSLYKLGLLNGLNTYNYMIDNLDCPDQIKNRIRQIFLNDSSKLHNLTTTRKSILLQYLSWRLKISIDEILILIDKYPSVSNRSLKGIQASLDLYFDYFKFDSSMIKRNGFLLMKSTTHLESLMNQVPDIAGIPIKEIGNRIPRILSMPAESLVEIKRVLFSHGITDEQMRICLNVFTLAPRTIDERFKNLKKISELEIMLTYPRILYLIYCYNKAIKRLEFMKGLGYECLSLDLLISSNSNYKKTIHLEDTVLSISFRGKEMIQYLSSLFAKSIDEIKDKLNMHPSNSRKGAVNCKKVVSFLLSEGFSMDEIYSSLYIILYDINDIKSTYEYLFSDEVYKDYQSLWRQSSVPLEFIVYMLERDINFSGQAVWSENVSHWNCDNLSTPSQYDSQKNVTDKFNSLTNQ